MPRLATLETPRMDDPPQSGKDDTADDHVDAAVVALADQDRPCDAHRKTPHDVCQTEPPADQVDDDARGVVQIESHMRRLPPSSGVTPERWHMPRSTPFSSVHVLRRDEDFPPDSHGDPIAANAGHHERGPHEHGVAACHRCIGRGQCSDLIAVGPADGEMRMAATNQDVLE